VQSWLNFDAHTGTHIDAPAHFLKGGSTIEDLDLNTLIGNTANGQAYNKGFDAAARIEGRHTCFASSIKGIKCLINVV
jgi:kynurenine formamidase